MGTLQNTAIGQKRYLEQLHGVGRATVNALCLEEPYVSHQHALIRWSADCWEVKDLGSRNGTSLNGERLAPGAIYKLNVGDRLCFGKDEQEWHLAEDSPPSVMVVPHDGSLALLADDEPLAVPSPQLPEATLYRTADGAWILEQKMSVSPMEDQQTFVAGGKTWKFCCPVLTCTTALLTASFEVKHLRLVFSVSRDEEYVHLQGSCGARRLDFADRGHNYLLALLARRRLADRSAGLPESACGWCDHDDVRYDATATPQQLNIDVFRIRKQFAAAGILDAATIIERRPRTRQLRIGVANLEVVTV
jgi:FHA domain